MLVFLWAGFECERIYGKWRMLALYLLSGIGATLFSAIYHIDSLIPPGKSDFFWIPSIMMSIGASGAIMGILAANVVMLINNDDLSSRGDKSVSSTFGVIAVTLLYGLKSGVDNASHIGGLLSGLIIGVVYLLIDNKLRKNNSIATLLATIAITGLIGVYYHSKVSWVFEECKSQRNDILDHFEMENLKRQKEADKEKKETDTKIAESSRLSDARKLHDSFPPAVDEKTAMGTMLDIPAPTSVVTSHDGNSYYVGVYGSNSIIILDAHTYKGTGEIAAPECKGDGCDHDPVSTLALSSDGKTLYATSLVKNALSVIDLKTNKIEINIPVGKMPDHMVLSPDGTIAWVLNQLDNSISAIDLNVKQVIKEIKLPGKYDGYSSNFNARPIAISHDGNTLAAYDTAEKKLLTIDTKTFQLQVASAVTRLENSASHESLQPALTLPPQALASEEDPSAGRLVYVIRSEPEVDVQVVHDTLPPPARWPAFVAGACSALVASAIVLAGWHYLHRVDDAAGALAASVTPLPQALSATQLQALQQSDKEKPDPAIWLKNASSQLNRLAVLPPDWAYQYGNGLLAQASALWPGNPDVEAMNKQWQQRLAAYAISGRSLTGWHDGMQQLQTLTDRLNTLDGQKGKYITVSELKSSVFAMMNSFGQTVPLEEQLRLLQTQDSNVALATQQQIQQHFHGLQYRYSLLAKP